MTQSSIDTQKLKNEIEEKLKTLVRINFQIAFFSHLLIRWEKKSVSFLKRIVSIVLFSLLPLQLFAGPALPPLVPEGENFADFPGWMIDENSAYFDATVSPDGKLIAGSTRSGVQLWDLHNRRLLHTFGGGAAPSVNFSPNGKILVASSSETIFVWDIQSKKRIHRLEGHSKSITSLHFSPDGKNLASSSYDNTIKLWDIQAGELLHTLTEHSETVRKVLFSPDGKLLASYGYGNNTIQLWDMKTRNLLHTFEGHTESVASLSFSPDGQTIASGSWDKTIKLWDIQSKQLLHTFIENSAVYLVNFHPDGKKLASNNSNALILWDVQAKRRLGTLAGHSSLITSVNFSPDGQTLISSSHDQTLRQWDINTGNQLHTFQTHTGDVNSVSFSPDGNTFTTSSGGTLKLWDLQSKQLIYAFDDNTHYSHTSEFSPDGKILVSASNDLNIEVWDTQSKNLLYIFNTSGSTHSINFSPNGKMLAVGYADLDNTAKIWDIQTKKWSHTFKGHSKDVTSVNFSPDGKTLASGSEDNTVKLWDIQTQTLIHTFGETSEDSSGHISSVSFSPDGKLLASGSGDNTIKLWDLSSQSLLHTFTGHTSKITSVKFSPNGKIIASSSHDNTIKLWDVANKRLLPSFKGQHRSWVESISFSPNGETLISGSRDNYVKHWNIGSGKLLHAFIGGVAGNWLSHDKKHFLRGDDGSLLLERNSGDLQPILPNFFTKNKVIPPKLHHLNTSLIDLSTSKIQNLTFDVTNTSQQTLYWPQIELAEGSFFNHHSFDGEAPNIIEPGKTARIHTKIGAHLGNIIQPEKRTLKLRVVAPGQTNSDWLEIPVQVNAPKLEVTEATLLKDENIIKLRIDNKGTQAIANTFYTLNLNSPDLLDLDIQNARDAIEPNGFIERSFSVPKGFDPNKGHTVKLDVRNAALPLMTWSFEPTLTLPKPSLWMYAGLAVLAMLSAFGTFYFRRYRHPLLVGLSDEPQSLLKLPPEQLPEAQQRLQQTKRLDTVLSDASVSPKTLKQALDFPKWSVEQKTSYIAQRIGGTLIEKGFASTLKTPENFPLNIDKILLHFPTEAPEDVFQTLKTSASTQNKITLIIGPDSDYQRKLYSTTKQLDNKWVASQGSELTHLLLSPNPESALAEILSGQLSLQQISPYRVGGGVSNESVFFGRRELIAQITNRDPANYLMVGGRQVGKSTLLKALERRYADNPQVQCHYLTLSNEVLVPRLAALLKLDKTNDPEALASQLDERIQQDGQRYIFLIDEADRFIEQEKEQDYPILNVFRRLSEEGNCVFILAGFWQLYQHAVLDYQSPIRNFGELLSVGALEKPACIELVTEPMRSMNLLWDNETIVEQLVYECGQRANLIAIACQHIVRNLPPQQRTITAGDMHKALYSDEMRRALTGWVVGITEEEQTYERLVIYATIEHDDFTTADLLEMAKQQKLQLDTKQLEQTLSRLELAFILGRDKGRWFYRVPLFMEYIKEDAPAAKLEAEMTELLTK